MGHNKPARTLSLILLTGGALGQSVFATNCGDSQRARVQEDSRLGNLPTGFRDRGSRELTVSDANLRITSSLGIPSRGLAMQYRAESGRMATYWDVELKLSDEPSERSQQISDFSKRFGRSAELGVPLLSQTATDVYLSDFLPARMQALQGSSFVKVTNVTWGILGRSELDRDPLIDNFVLKPELRKVTNCWTTAFELLRPTPLSFESWFASDRHVHPYLDGMNRDGSIHNRDTEWNTFVKELSWQEACVPTQRRMCPDGDLFQARNERLENGDVLVISSDKGIEHAAIYLGSDLYFEKTGAKSDTELYRMVPFDEIANTYRDPELRYRYRRPKKDATLPPHSSAFQESQHEVEEAIWNLMPAELKSLGAAPFWQPEVGDSRDLGIYLSEQRTIVFDRNNRARWAEP